MKKLILPLLLFIIIFFTGCSKKENISQLDEIMQRDVLIVGVKTDSKPFGYINKTTGEIEGFDIDVAKYIAKDLLGSERKIKFIPVTPATRIEAITSGQADMIIATMSITPQRQFLIDFTIPYYIAGQTAIVKQDSDIYNFADLKKKKTIVVLGTTSEQNIRKIIPTAKLIGYKNYEEAFIAFKNGEADAISSDNTILSGFLIDNKGFRILKNRISQEPYAIGIRKNENDESLKKNLNIVLKRMQKDGTIKALKKKWQL